MAAKRQKMKDIDHSWVFKKRGMIGIIFLFLIGVALSFSYPMIKTVLSFFFNELSGIFIA